jgi:hypothetical protein
MMLQWLRIAVQIANSYSNLIIAFATVFIAGLTIILAITATRQTDVAMRALELNSRPYIAFTIHPDTFYVKPDERMRATITFRNFGSTPAEVNIRGVFAYSLTKLSAPSLVGIKEEPHLVIPKSPDQNIDFLYSPEKITEGQFTDLLNGKGFLYIHILATYGIYHMEICDEYGLTKSPTGTGVHGNFSDMHRCEDKTSNSAN